MEAAHYSKILEQAPTLYSILGFSRLFYNLCPIHFFNFCFPSFIVNFFFLVRYTELNSNVLYLHNAHSLMKQSAVQGLQHIPSSIRVSASPSFIIFNIFICFIIKSAFSVLWHKQVSLRLIFLWTNQKSRNLQNKLYEITNSLSLQNFRCRYFSE